MKQACFFTDSPSLKTFEPNTNYLIHCCSEDFISKPYCGVGYLPRQRFYREVQFLNLFPAGQLLQPRHPIPPNFLKLSVDLFDAGREWSLWRSCKRVEWLVNIQPLAICQCFPQQNPLLVFSLCRCKIHLVFLIDLSNCNSFNS